MSQNSLGYQNNSHPLAQSIFIDDPNGIYLTKIDLYFRSKDATLPVQVHLRPMVNGFPSTDVILPQSTVFVNGPDINTSDDASAETSFEFQEPVYLKGFVDYAIVVQCQTSATQIYIAQVDEYVLGTTAARVNKNPAVGTIFYSQNGATWTPSQNQDLKFRLHRMSMTATSGSIYLKAASIPERLLPIDPIFTTNGSSSVRVAMEQSGLVVNDQISIRGVNAAVGGIAASALNGTQTVTAVDWTGFTFTAGSSATANEQGGGEAVYSSQNYPFSHFFSNIQMLQPVGTRFNNSIRTSLTKSYAGTETAYGKEVTFTGTVNGETQFFNTARVAMNDSIGEANHGISFSTLDYKLDISTADSQVTPMLDLQRASINLIDNIIDKQDSASTSGFNVPLNFVDETDPKDGSSAAKHLTTPITLLEDAVGLKIQLAANRPSGTDFQVYYRTSEDGVDIRNVNWEQVTEISNNGTDDNILIYREYEYLAGGPGGDLNAFTTFQIKIVFRSTNAALVPRIKDLRVIALSV
jgi:hypothetical protein